MPARRILSVGPGRHRPPVLDPRAPGAGGQQHGSSSARCTAAAATPGAIYNARLRRAAQPDGQRREPRRHGPSSTASATSGTGDVLRRDAARARSPAGRPLPRPVSATRAPRAAPSIPTPDASVPGMHHARHQRTGRCSPTTTTSTVRPARSAPDRRHRYAGNALVGPGRLRHDHRTASRRRLAPAPDATRRRSARSGRRHRQQRHRLHRRARPATPPTPLRSTRPLTVDRPGRQDRRRSASRSPPFDLAATGGTPPYTWADRGHCHPGITVDRDGTGLRHADHGGQLRPGRRRRPTRPRHVRVRHRDLHLRRSAAAPSLSRPIADDPGHRRDHAVRRPDW